MPSLTEAFGRNLSWPTRGVLIVGVGILLAWPALFPELFAGVDFLVRISETAILLCCILLFLNLWRRLGRTLHPSRSAFHDSRYPVIHLSLARIAAMVPAGPPRPAAHERPLCHLRLRSHGEHQRPLSRVRIADRTSRLGSISGREGLRCSSDLTVDLPRAIVAAIRPAAVPGNTSWCAIEPSPFGVRA